MARIDQLLTSYRRHVSLTPRGNLPLSQRVWFVLYPPEDERRMVNRIPELEIATREEGLRRLPEKNIPGCAGFSFVFKER
jgi:hypothetical protein